MACWSSWWSMAQTRRMTASSINAIILQQVNRSLTLGMQFGPGGHSPTRIKSYRCRFRPQRCSEYKRLRTISEDIFSTGVLPNVWRRHRARKRHLRKFCNYICGRKRQHAAIESYFCWVQSECALRELVQQLAPSAHAIPTCRRLYLYTHDTSLMTFSHTETADINYYMY